MLVASLLSGKAMCRDKKVYDKMVGAYRVKWELHAGQVLSGSELLFFGDHLTNENAHIRYPRNAYPMWVALPGDPIHIRHQCTTHSAANLTSNVRGHLLRGPLDI